MTLLVSLIARIDTGAIRSYRGKTGFSMESFEDFGAVMGEAIPGPGPCSTYTRRISWDSENEFLCA